VDRLFFFLSLFVFYLYSKPLDSQVSARAAILINADTGKVLYEKNAHLPQYPASLTKMATGIFIIENTASLTSKITASSHALDITEKKTIEDLPYVLEEDGTMIGLKEGETIPLKGLLYGMLVATANDASNVLAEAIGGTIPDFMEELNEYLRNIGCEKTCFLNPHGLHHPDHKTTAYDLSLIAKRAIQDPFFRKIVSSERYFLPKTNKSGERQLRQTNPLIRKDSPDYYSSAFGIKTGNHSKAKKCLAASARKNGRTLIAILLGCNSKNHATKDAKLLFDHAFSEKKKTRAIVKKNRVFTFDLNGARALVYSSLKEDLKIQYYPSEEPNLKAFIHWDDLTLPINRDQKVGELQLLDEDENIVAASELYAKETIKSTLLASLKNLLGWK